MQWWEWVTWGVAILTGGTGLVLGVRAERRTRYKPLWVLDDESASAINRTGEDALHVQLFLLTQPVEFISHQRLVQPDENAYFAHTHAGIPLAVLWVRPSTEKFYVWPTREKGKFKRQRRRWNEVRKNR